MVPLVLVVSRNPGLAMTLGSESFEVASLRPAELTDWTANENRRPDAVLLDVEHAQDALDRLTDMRAHGNLAPVLILSGESTEWREAEWLDLPGARILPLPISRAAILLALDDALREPDIAPYELPSAPRNQLHDALSDTGLEGLEDLPFPEIPAFPADVPRSEGASPATTPTGVAERGTVQTQDRPVPRPASPAAPPPAPVVREEHSLVEEPAPAPTPEPVPEPEPLPVPAYDDVLDVESAQHLVALLLAQVDQLMTLRETAEIVCSDLVQRMGADAAVLLLPDGERWRVAGGVGLRTIENRFELAANSWLVEKIALAGQGAIIEDTDVARSHLAGAPLASHRNLVAAPVVGPDGILLVARKDDPPFTKEELAFLADTGREAAGYLSAALDLRRLARALQEHRDVR